MNVSVLIPAFNEEEKIRLTIETISKLESVKEVIVIDDGSTDLTYQQAIKTNAQVIRLPYNQGKGAALNCGIKQAKQEIVLLLDADLGATAVEANKLLFPIFSGTADMTIAKFRVTSGGGLGLVKKLATWGLKKITGKVFKAPLSGQRAINRQALKKVQKFAAGFGVEVALTIAIWQENLKIIEVPVNMKHSSTGKNLSGFWHRGKQFKDIAAVLASQLRE